MRNRAGQLALASQPFAFFEKNKEQKQEFLTDRVMVRLRSDGKSIIRAKVNQDALERMYPRGAIEQLTFQMMYSPENADQNVDQIQQVTLPMEEQGQGAKIKLLCDGLKRFFKRGCVCVFNVEEVCVCVCVCVCEVGRSSDAFFHERC
jgi:hypothetical protein